MRTICKAPGLIESFTGSRTQWDSVGVKTRRDRWTGFKISRFSLLIPRPVCQPSSRRKCRTTRSTWVRSMIEIGTGSARPKIATRFNAISRWSWSRAEISTEQSLRKNFQRTSNSSQTSTRIKTIRGICKGWMQVAIHFMSMAYAKGSKFRVRSAKNRWKSTNSALWISISKMCAKVSTNCPQWSREKCRPIGYPQSVQIWVSSEMRGSLCFRRTGARKSSLTATSPSLWYRMVRAKRLLTQKLAVSISAHDPA